MKIAFFEVQDWEKPSLENSFPADQVQFSGNVLDEKNVKAAKDAEVVSVFIYSNLNQSVLSQMRNLKLVVTRSTGFDHIDSAYCNSRGIAICNIPTYGEITVAQHAIALILSLSRNMTDSIERTRKGDFSCPGVQGFDLDGKTLGVLGTGRIGRHVIQMAKGFNMSVIAWDKYPNHKASEQLGFQYADAETVLRKADVLTLHLPLKDETHHIINKESLKAMKPSAMIVNTARGGLIDTEALTEALVNGKLAGAGLDVLEEESAIREEAQLLFDTLPRKKLETALYEHVLLRQKNVIITPHCAFNSKESLKRLVNTTIENIHCFTNGNPQNVVNKPAQQQKQPPKIAAAPAQ